MMMMSVFVSMGGTIRPTGPRADSEPADGYRRPDRVASAARWCGGPSVTARAKGSSGRLDLRKKRSHQRETEMDLTSGEAEKDKRLRDRAGDERQNATAWLHDIRRLVRDDPKLAEYVDAVEIGCGEPAEIADVCQVDVTDICSRRRKLKRSSPAISMGGRRHDKEVERSLRPSAGDAGQASGPGRGHVCRGVVFHDRRCRYRRGYSEAEVVLAGQRDAVDTVGERCECLVGHH
jgi:hypothetical protein